ncbi:MAG: transcription-repair coupling factor [Ignavibacteriaceae bacterium]|nr:transcription-repair coupling factor [Ignavibacteriaceae bacterium]
MKKFNILNDFSYLPEVKSFLTGLTDSTEKVFEVTGVSGSSNALLAGSLISKYDKILFLFEKQLTVNEFAVELTLLYPDKKIIQIDEFTVTAIQEKISEILKSEEALIISTFRLLTVKLPPRKQVEQNLYSIKMGANIEYSYLTDLLDKFEYRSEKFVAERGTYAVRGSIIDLWSYSEKNPVRIEFDGDFVESLRVFDPESQRSVEKIDESVVSENMEKLFLDENQEKSDIFEYIDELLTVAHKHEFDRSLTDYVLPEKEEKPQDGGKTDENIYLDDFPDDDDLSDGEEDDIQVSDQKLISYVLSRNNCRWILISEISEPGVKYDLGFSSAPSINSSYEMLFGQVKGFLDKNFKIIITAENDIQTGRLRDLFTELRQELADFITDGTIHFETLPLKSGFTSRSEKMLFLTDYQIFGKPYRTKIPNIKNRKKSRKKEFLSIVPGDFVVHEEYGIAKYAGLSQIKIGEAEQETMKLIFNEAGIVYVNLNYLHLVKKYSSKEGAVPSLSTLGSNTWLNAKARTKKKIKELARDLIELYARRKSAKGFQFSTDTVWQKELEASFIYEDTPDQIKVVAEVKEDMETPSPMDRLVCGDVGFGKTEIAVRAAFKAVQDGKQVAVLVPTTILAEQHYNTFRDRLSQFPARVECLSRFQTKMKQKEIVQGVKENKVDVLVGTHRLLSKDVTFHDLGLLIIDEEHRFGVKAKENLRSKKLNVDTLTLTATPIPRTLNFSLHGARDLSIIGTPPPNRQPIYTKVAVFDIKKIREWIHFEMKRNGQVYIVHDRIQSIYRFADYLKKHIPEIKMGIAHGQMKPLELEDVIHGFQNRKYDILLSTKIIESGIDIPNVNTIIVNRADRFGLAELHQLRGRVGRSDRQAYAYFLVPTFSGLQKKTIERLKVIEEFTDLGSGFSIAMRDLEIRGAGNLLGTEQSGFINEVGFDMYMKLVNEAVEELKYQEFYDLFKDKPKQKQKTDPSIDTFFDIGIPANYMPEQTDRLSFYTALLSLQNLSDLEDIKEELTDRFGPMPVNLRRLMGVAVIKFHAAELQLERVILQRQGIIIVLPSADKEEFYKLDFPVVMKHIMERHYSTVKIRQEKESVKLVINAKFESPEKMIEYVTRFIAEISELLELRDKKVRGEAAEG